jgi:hypothetical protein
MGHHGFLRGSIYLVYVDDFRTSQQEHLWASTVCYRNGSTLGFLCLYFKGNTPKGLHGMIRGSVYFFICG